MVSWFGAQGKVNAATKKQKQASTMTSPEIQNEKAILNLILKTSRIRR